jgi:hypothetical protein
MIRKKAEIFYGDIGTVRNELSGFMKNVNEVISLSQSVTASASHTNAMLTVVLIYTENVECPEELKYKPNDAKEQYL